MDNKRAALSLALNLPTRGVWMRKKLHIIGLLAVTSLIFSGCSRNSPATRAAIEQCDELAAHPQDTSRTVKEGVEDDRIAAGAAIPACQSAVEAYPDEARYAFQLGRAYIAAGRTEEATEVLKSAVEMNYAPAFKVFGDLAFPHDPAQAKEMYEYAAERGFSPAVAALEEMKLAVLTPELFSAMVRTESGCNCPVSSEFIVTRVIFHPSWVES